jgi:hypothetical protein
MAAVRLGTIVRLGRTEAKVMAANTRRNGMSIGADDQRIADIAEDFGVPEPEVEDVVRVATRAAA